MLRSLFRLHWRPFRLYSSSPSLSVTVKAKEVTVQKIKKSANEINNDVDVSVVSGAPSDLRVRTVRIFRPSPSATQSGVDHTRVYKIEWLNEPQWSTNPLVGWASTSDYMQGTNLSFCSLDEAIRFADRQGWAYEVDHENNPKFQVKTYANNFTFKAKKLRLHHTK